MKRHGVLGLGLLLGGLNVAFLHADERRFMPQIYGWNNSASQDGDPHLELNDHEKLNLRLLLGINF